MNEWKWKANAFGKLVSGAMLMLSAVGLHAQSAPNETRFHLEQVTGPNGVGTGHTSFGKVEIWGVGVERFGSELWVRNTLHWVPDLRMPLLTPKQSGPFRNIYAPSVVPDRHGWHLLYAGWDGADSANDRVYVTDTEDFVDFGMGRLLIEHGAFNHVSNVVAKSNGSSHLSILATAAVTRAGKYENSNKPLLFNGVTSSALGTVRYDAGERNLVQVSGFPDYDHADLNGANALLLEEGASTLYFSDWKHPGNIHYAKAEEANSFKYEGVALKSDLAANDVISLSVEGKKTRVMGLYKKGDVGLSARGSEQLWYSLDSGQGFGAPQPLFAARGAEDRFIFSMCFVNRGDQVLGVLYGAGGDSNDSRNSIFAKWLQKRLVLKAKEGLEDGNGAEYGTDGAIGPDRQIFSLPRYEPFEGDLLLYDESGQQLLGSTHVQLKSGGIYRLVWDDAGKKAEKDVRRHQ